MATIKKASKGTFSPKSSNVSKRLGSYGKKMKSGGSFPDLNKDGKVTKKDVLIGRGVLPKTAKKGVKVKKAQNGKMQKITKRKSGTPSPKMQLEMEKFKYQRDMDRMKLDREMGKEKELRPKSVQVGKPNYKKGGKMTKKCMYGCK